MTHNFYICNWHTECSVSLPKSDVKVELLARQDAKDVSPWPQKITFDKARYFDQKCHYAFSNIENFSFNLFLIINVTKIFKILKIVTIIVPFLIIFKKMNGLFLQFKQVQ